MSKRFRDSDGPSLYAASFSSPLPFSRRPDLPQHLTIQIDTGQTSPWTKDVLQTFSSTYRNIYMRMLLALALESLYVHSHPRA